MIGSGRLLRVDLSRGTSVWEALPDGWERSYPGGRSLGVRLLHDTIHLPPEAPEQGIAFAPGLLCDSGAPAANRLAIVFRSPLTQTICDVSDGGPLAIQLTRAGCAALLITGESPVPVVLEITPEGVRLHDGRRWWGMAADATIAALGDGTCGVAAIGPAGEHAVPLAALHCGDGNLTGRGGLGAVCGRKRLKAIVVRGGDPPAALQNEDFTAACSDLLRLFRATPVLLGELGFAAFGTATLMDLAAHRGVLSRNNFRQHASAVTAVSGPALQSFRQAQGFGCCGCPIACKRRTPDGQPLPEFDTLAACGALLGFEDATPLLAVNQLCNALGLDPISTAATLATYAELRGTPLTAAETIALLPQVARREGEGAPLANGARRYAIAQGQPDAALTVKGLELASLDPRGLYGLALACAVSSHGSADHASTLGPELLRKPVPVDRLSLSGKARLVRLAEDTVAAADTLGICRHALYGAGLEELAALCSAATERPWRAADLQELGAQTVLRERYYNQRNGFSAADDTLPTRLLGTDSLLAPARLQDEVQRYYRLRGLDAQGQLPETWLEEQP